MPKWISTHPKTGVSEIKAITTSDVRYEIRLNPKPGYFTQIWGARFLWNTFRSQTADYDAEVAITDAPNSTDTKFSCNEENPSNIAACNLVCLGGSPLWTSDHVFFSTPFETNSVTLCVRAILWGTVPSEGPGCVVSVLVETKKGTPKNPPVFDRRLRGY